MHNSSGPGELVGSGQVINGETFVAYVEYKIQVSQGSIGVGARLDLTLSAELPNDIPLHTRLTLVTMGGAKLDFFDMGNGQVEASGVIH